MKINKNSLQARIKNLAQLNGIPSNVVLQNYFFDAFLKRLAKSKYCDKFVFKGGYLLSTLIGINNRATVDMDFHIEHLKIEEQNIRHIFEDISSIDVQDNVSFEFMDISEIRPDDEYGGFNICLLGKLENIRELVSVDVATGDPIMPGPISFEYKCLFDNELLNLKRYSFETIISEKLQTLLSRSVLNSRAKDYYDLFVIFKMRWSDIDIEVLKRAFRKTCEYRKTIFDKSQSLQILEEIKTNERMKNRWKSYADKKYFTKNISFEDTLEAVEYIINAIFA